VETGVSAEIIQNTFADYVYTGSGDPYSSGIDAFDGYANDRRSYVPLFPLRCEANTFTNNDEHVVLIGANQAEVRNNKFVGNGPNPPRWGAVAISGTNIVIENNNFSDLPT